VLTIHNLAFQGQYGCDVFEGLGLPEKYLSLDCLLHYGDLSFLKAGITQASSVTTVSPTYAREICLDQHGMGMAGVLRSGSTSLLVIVNWVDYEVCDPKSYRLMLAKYNVNSLDLLSERLRFLDTYFGFVEDCRSIIRVLCRFPWLNG